MLKAVNVLSHTHFPCLALPFSVFVIPADYLRDEIYELRVSLQGVQYRMLYFFHGKVAAVVSHGLVKEQKVPPKEIDVAVRRKRLFEQNPKRHTYEDVS